MIGESALDSVSGQEISWAEERKSLVKEIGRLLVKSRAIKFGTFTLTGGMVSSYYIDLRIVPSYPEIFRRIVESYLALVREAHIGEVDVIAGVATSGLIYSTAVAYELEKPLVYLRKEERSHGTARGVEGIMKPGSRVLVMDDVITSGESIIHAARKIRSSGGVVERSVVLIDRQEGGEENLRRDGIELIALASISEIGDHLHEMKIIDDSQRDALRAEAGLSTS